MTLPLMAFQEVGADAMHRRQRYGLFDEMGLGKSCQAIRAADIVNAIRGIVVCPAIARQNWCNEFKKFARIPRRVIKASTIHDFVAWVNGRFDVLVVSYDMMTKWAGKFCELCEPIDFLVFDEAHLMKDEMTRRARMLLGSAQLDGIQMWAAHSWWLTGTPIPNDPADIYTFLRFVKAMPLSKPAFIKRYFDSKQKSYSSAQSPKGEMIPEIRALIANNSIRRTLAEAGVDLPKVFLTTSFVDGDTKPVRDLLAAHPGIDQVIKDALENGHSISNLDVEWIGTLRRLIGEAKAVPYAAQLLHELHSGIDKIVVFGLHRAALNIVLDYLRQHGIDARLINGETSERERQRHMIDFQSNPACRVFLANIRAAGTALTLTAACFIDVLESDYSPAANAQALKRVHRISQTRTVRARFITLADSFDETVNEILAEKTAKIALLTGGVSPSLENN